MITLIYMCGKPTPKKQVTYYPSGEIQTIVKWNFPKDSTRQSVKWYRKDGTKSTEGVKKNNKKEGVWNYYDNKERIKASENFRNGMLCDTQINYYPTGDIQEIMILEDSIKSNIDSTCNYTHYYYLPNEKLHEINHWKECQVDKAILFDSLTGKIIKKRSFKKGVLNGTYENHFDDGSVMKGEYLDGEPYGKWLTTIGDSIISEKQY